MIIDSFSEEEQEGDYLKDGAFVPKEVKLKVDELLADIETDEISLLQNYLKLSKKKEKTEFIQTHKEVDWSSMQNSNNGTYTKTIVTARINELKRSYPFKENSFEHKMITVLETTERESVLKREIKEEQAELHVRTKELIQQMNYNDAIAVLSEKWISPIVDGIYR